MGLETQHIGDGVAYTDGILSFNLGEVEDDEEDKDEDDSDFE